MSKDCTNIPNTCPKIDEVICALDDATFNDNSWWTQCRIIEIMEDIRSANSELRSIANEQYNEREQLQIKLDSAELQIECLKEDIKYYEKEINK